MAGGTDKRRAKALEDMEGLDARKPFYIAVSTHYMDGSFEVSGEGIEATTVDLDEATGTAREVVEEFGQEEGFECVVLRCVPVRIIKRGKIVIRDLSAK